MRLTRVRIPIKLGDENRGGHTLEKAAILSSLQRMGDRPTVGLQILDLAILVRIQVSQPICSSS
jgi:hypothetical protein